MILGKKKNVPYHTIPLTSAESPGKSLSHFKSWTPHKRHKSLKLSRALHLHSWFDFHRGHSGGHGGHGGHLHSLLCFGIQLKLPLRQQPGRQILHPHVQGIKMGYPKSPFLDCSSNVSPVFPSKFPVTTTQF